MKIVKLFLATIIFSFSLANVHSQTAFPSYESSPIWHIVQWDDLSQDTIYYTIQSNSGYEACGWHWSVALQFDDVGILLDTIGYYRVDEEKVFFKPQLDCEVPEALLYDFGLSQGNEAHFAFYPYQNIADTTLFQVLFSSNTIIEGVARNQQLLKYFFTINDIEQSANTLWIKGIGDRRHPFHSTLCLLDSFCVTSLVTCLEVEGELVYQAPDWYTCSPEKALTRIYVDKNRIGGKQDGSSWENAIKDLQDALKIVDTGDSIWVAASKYFPTKTDDRNISFKVTDSVKLFGGFSGNENFLHERNIYTNTTTLSGDIGLFQDSTDNSFHVIDCYNCSNETLISGFVIEKGQAIDGEAQTLNPNNYGGGIYIHGNKISPKIINCIIQDNTAYFGAGIQITNESNTATLPFIAASKFKNNNGEFLGGGLNIDATSSPNAEFMLHKDTFECNISFVEGGGVNINNLSVFKADSCIFFRNVTNQGAGISYFNISGVVNAELNHCVFEQNEARVFGGFFFSSSPPPNSTDDSTKIKIENCFFNANVSTQSSGSALFTSFGEHQSSVEILETTFQGNGPRDAISIFLLERSQSNYFIDRCVFMENAVNGQVGGAINVYGSNIDEESEQFNATILNSIFVRNGGAITILSGVNGQMETLISNSTFFKNGAYTLAKNWGESSVNTVDIKNSIFWEEETLLPGLGSIFYNGNPDNISAYDYNIEYTLISSEGCIYTPGGLSACGDGLLFNIYPEFLDTLNSDFRLSSCSPLINKGSNAIFDNLSINQDLQNNNRILNDTVDLGAYETEKFNLDIQFTIIDVTNEAPNSGRITIENIVGGTPPYQYNWSNGEAEVLFIDNLEVGEYQVSVTDQTFCSQVFTFTVDLITSNQEINSIESFKVFPTLVNDVVNVEIFDNCKVFLLDAFGNVLFEKQIFEKRSNKTFQINLSEFPVGIYFIQFSSNDQLYTSKIIKI